MRKSSSLHDLSSEDQEMRETLESSRYLSRSGDRLDTIHSFTVPRSSPPNINSSPPFILPPTRSALPSCTFLTPKNTASSHSSISSMSSTNSGSNPRPDPLEERSANIKLHRERSSSLKDFSTQLSISGGNETDELKVCTVWWVC